MKLAQTVMAISFVAIIMLLSFGVLVPRFLPTTDSPNTAWPESISLLGRTYKISTTDTHCRQLDFLEKLVAKIQSDSRKFVQYSTALGEEGTNIREQVSRCIGTLILRYSSSQNVTRAKDSIITNIELMVNNPSILTEVKGHRVYLFNTTRLRELEGSPLYGEISILARGDTLYVTLSDSSLLYPGIEKDHLLFIREILLMRA